MGQAWFGEWLGRQIDSRGITNAEFARDIGCHGSDVSRWRGGASPGVSVLEKILAYFGGDLKRALPDWKGEPTPTIDIEGTITDGALKTITPYPKGLREHWRKAAAFAQTKGGEPVYHSVEGDSLLPEFPHGSTVVCGEPRSKATPRQTPQPIMAVVELPDGERLIKMVERVGDQVVLSPVGNSNQQKIVVPVNQVKIAYHVLGSIR